MEIPFWTTLCISFFFLGIGLGAIIEYRIRRRLIEQFDTSRFQLEMALSNVALVRDKLVRQMEEMDKPVSYEDPEITLTSEIPVVERTLELPYDDQ